MRKKGFSVLSEGPMHKLDNTKTTAETKNSINFTESKKKFCTLKSVL